MTVRGLDGDDDVIRFPAPAYGGGAFSMVAVVKRLSSPPSWDGIVSIGGPGSLGPEVFWGWNDTDGGMACHFAAAGVSWETNVAASAGSGWRMVALTHPSGSRPGFHAYDGTTWTHLEVGSLTASDPGDWTGKELRIGNWNSLYNFFEGLGGVVAFWEGTVLTIPQVEALVGGDRDAWAAAGADHIWELDGSVSFAVADQVGTLDQASIVGTSEVTGDDPPSTLYNFIGSLPPDTDPYRAKILTPSGWMDLTGPAGSTEPIPVIVSFSMAPVAVEAWPPAFALRSTIIGVMGWNNDGGTGETIHIDFNYHSRDLDDDITISTFGSFTLGYGAFWQFEEAMDIGGRVELGIGDYYWPEVTAGSGSSVVAGFIILPNVDYQAIYP